MSKSHEVTKRVSKADEYHVCDICGKNVPITRMAGECKGQRCGNWICKNCDTQCEDCKRVFCDKCTQLVEVEKGKKKTLCTQCKPTKKGCFIATAAYGTPFAKEIDVLRSWRDKSLETNILGLIFVKFYYKISPPIAKIVEKSEILKSLVRTSLKPYIRYLKRRNY